MSDLIDREAALNCYHDWVDQYGDVHTPDEIPEYQAIEALPSAQPEPRWIPCSERLPFDAGYYLTTTTYNEVFCDYWNLNEWNRTEQVIAWMYMPEPFMEDDRMKDDTISRQAVLKLLAAMPPEDATTKALLIQSVKQMSAAQPDEEKVSNILYNIYRNTSPHTSAEGVAAVKYYIREIYREIYGEEGPKWMKK